MTLKKALAQAATITALATVACGIDFAPSEDGIYAVFTTNQGEFAAKLYYEDAPVTVANFVGLAEGSIYRWNAETQETDTSKFYDGISFHRVISGFVIQGGSPNGLGTDGPGYSIPDEMQPNLKHTKAGILSMANSGPNSGGSQFFITLGATPWLDGKHAVFGEIVSGSQNVTAIGNTPTDANDRPTSPVTIQELTILRVGEAAQQFDPRDYDLPSVGYPKISFELESNGATASFPRTWNAFYNIRRTTDFENWEVDNSLVPNREADPAHEIDISEDMANAGASFLEVTEITTFKTLDATGTDLAVNLEGNSTINISLTGTSGGTYTFGGDAGTVTGYYWYPISDRDQLYIGYSGLRTMQLYFTWTSETGGTVFAYVSESFSGAQNDFTVEGTFTANARPD